MSSPLAIASVTRVLKDLLNNGLVDHDVSGAIGGNVTVTALSPDRVSVQPGSSEANQLNVFMHQVRPNAGWRNVELPTRNSSGERIGNPLLALNLHYLITGYGADELNGEILLGYAMQLLHENPVLSRQAIRAALANPAVNGSILPPAFQAAAALSPEAREPGFHLESLGSGSDYVAFLDHAGIASLNLGFASGDGVYHSIYDTLAWYQQFSDGDRTYGKALTQVMTITLLRLADAPLLPFDFGSLSASTARWMEEIRKQLPKGPAKLDLRAVSAQLTRLSLASKAYEEELSNWIKRAGSSTPDKLAKVDKSMRKTERTLLTADGLPGREWYRNQIYAPGMLTGYTAKTLPGVREAVEAQQWDEANRQARKLAETFRAAAAQVEEAARLLKQIE